MTDELVKRPLREVYQARERAIAALTEAFSRDDISIEELEARLTKVQSAEAVEAIDAIASDVAPAHAPLPTRTVLPPGEARREQSIKAIFGSTERRGAWTGAQTIRALSVCGASVLDFREARLPAGIIDLEVSAVLGSIEIIVPPDLAIETNGSGIAGSFEAVDRAPLFPDETQPLLRITGLAMFGSVEVQTRLVGESEAQTHRRLKAERKMKQLKSG